MSHWEIFLIISKFIRMHYYFSINCWAILHYQSNFEIVHYKYERAYKIQVLRCRSRRKRTATFKKKGSKYIRGRYNHVQKCIIPFRKVWTQSLCGDNLQTSLLCKYTNQVWQFCIMMLNWRRNSEARRTYEAQWICNAWKCKYTWKKYGRLIRMSFSRQIICLNSTSMHCQIS